MRTLLVLILFALAFPLRAENPYGYTFTISPNPVPATAKSITVTVESTSGHCLPLPDVLDKTVVDNIFYFDIPGAGSCGFYPPESRSYDTVALSSGDYIFRFVSCQGDYEGAPPCGVLEEIPVTFLTKAASPSTIPASSTTGLVVLALLALVAGVLARRGHG